MKRAMFAVVVLAIGATGCATKDYVNKQIADVNTKVSAVSKATDDNKAAIAKTDDKVAAHDQKIAAVDQKAEAAGRSAATAKSTADTAVSKTDALDKAMKKVIYEVAITQEADGFASDKAAITPAMQAKLDDVAAKYKANGNGAYLEIEGYTDSTGAKDTNLTLSQQRAAAVATYLHTKQNIPLHRMSVVGYGEDNPVAPNKTKDGRAKNRRVVIKILQ
jgi:peptidoglycan-associated lipoprotein